MSVSAACCCQVSCGIHGRERGVDAARGERGVRVGASAACPRRARRRRPRRARWRRAGRRRPCRSRGRPWRSAARVDARSSPSGRLPRSGGLAQPVLEADLAQLRAVARDEAALGRARCRSSARAGRRRPARGSPCAARRVADELVEAELLGPADLDGAVQRRAGRDPADRARRRRRPPWAGTAPAAAAPCRRRSRRRRCCSTNSKNCVAWTIEYGIEEPLISFSCGDLRAEVAAVGQPLGPDDRQRDVVADARRRSPRRGGCASTSRRTP